MTNFRLIIFLILLLNVFGVLPETPLAYAENLIITEPEEGFIRAHPIVFLATEKNKAISIINKRLANIPGYEKDNIGQTRFSEKSESLSFPLNLNLNEEEQEYLAGIDSIAICVDPDWMPYEKVDTNGRYFGLIAAYINILSQRLGKEFRLIRTSSWNESLSVARKRGCDILPGTVATPSRKEYLNFSDPYIFLPLVVVTNLDEIFIFDFQRVAGKKFAIIKGYAAIELLRKNYPKIVIREVPNTRTGLEMVLQNEVYGYIDTLPKINYQLQTNRMRNLKISGELDLVEYDVSIAVRNDLPLLLSIINKAIATISEEDRQKIFYSWISMGYQQEFDYELLKKILAVFIVLVLLLFYRNLIISRYNKKLIEANQQLDLLYKTDKLTGIFNRHILDAEIEKEVMRANRYNISFSVILMDIDHFKKINDTYGHYVGDSVLVEVAFILKNSLRKTDVVGRWGGEEFLVLCPETELVHGTYLAEKLRSKIEHHQFSGVDQTVTASFGVSVYRVDDTVESLIKRVDAALYVSKGNNRNCVTVKDI